MEPAPSLPDVGLPVASRRRSARRRRPSTRAPRALTLADQLTEGLILFLVVFTPWAFGTTQTWSIWTANAACHALGLILFAKLLLRHQSAYRPARWGDDLVVTDNSGEFQPPARRRPDPATAALAAITVALLAYVLVGLLNARADYDPATRSFQYLREVRTWLPTTYDRSASWFVFWQYLAWAAAFWAIRDWLLHRGPEERHSRAGPAWDDATGQWNIPARLRRLLWVLCLNAALLAAIAILQRADGTDKLLWILGSQRPREAGALFGPWAYRANAAQYFNLVWPVALAFWLWAQERASRAPHRQLGRLDGPQLVLLPCAIIAAVCPMISGSRGAAVVSALAGSLAIALVLLVSRRQISPTLRWLTAGGMLVAGLGAVIGGWSLIHSRLTRADDRFPTAIEVGPSDFTLLARVRLPEKPDGPWHPLASLSSSFRQSHAPHSLHLALNARGDFGAHLLGATPGDVNHLVAPRFLPRHAGREVLLSVTRDPEMRLAIDGVPIEAAAGTAGDAVGWNAYLATRYLFVSSPRVSEVALVHAALSPEELAAAAQVPLTTFQSNRVAHPARFRSDLLLTDVVVPDGVATEVLAPSAQPESRWRSIRREADPGLLGFGLRLAPPEPRLRGPLTMSFEAWNLGLNPLHLAVHLDGHPGGFVTLPPRLERSVSLPVRAPHGESPQAVEILLVDPEGDLLLDTPPDTQFLVRNLELAAQPAMVARTMGRSLRMLDLGDRLSGRHEYYENARRMALDHPLWGAGAGTFVSLYQLYLQPGQDWPGYLHNDWMETRLTLGPIGLGLVIAWLAALAWRSWRGPGLPTLRVVVALWWVALGGCLLHARFDFPFQIYSVVFLFLVLCAALTVITARPAR
ncbi:MAG: O-antigen ligase family protein [Verrucomicrobiae bacterium]|nr:O-antigen ligase family protein [Verrucomicrobiae bacterium]